MLYHVFKLIQSTFQIIILVFVSCIYTMTGFLQLIHVYSIIMHEYNSWAFLLFESIIHADFKAKDLKIVCERGDFYAIFIEHRLPQAKSLVVQIWVINFTFHLSRPWQPLIDHVTLPSWLFAYTQRVVVCAPTRAWQRRRSMAQNTTYSAAINHPGALIDPATDAGGLYRHRVAYTRIAWVTDRLHALHPLHFNSFRPTKKISPICIGALLAAINKLYKVMTAFDRTTE